jgi:hypothetical protein
LVSGGSCQLITRIPAETRNGRAAYDRPTPGIVL